MKIDPRPCSTIPAFAFRGVRRQMALHALLDHGVLHLWSKVNATVNFAYLRFHCRGRAPLSYK